MPNTPPRPTSTADGNEIVVAPSPEVKAPAAPQAEPAKPTTFIPNLSVTSTSIKIPSLKDMGKVTEKEKDEEDPYLRGNDKEQFTSDAFLDCWHKYAAKIKAQGKMTVLSIYTAAPPTDLGNFKYEIGVTTKSQEIAFREDKPNLMNYLRTTLRNFDIDVSTKIEEVTGARRPYTAVEKYQHMAGKNPELAELRKRFNLELE